jgi:hypothetical protein
MTHRWAIAMLLALALAGPAALLRPATAHADRSQTAIIEDGRVLAHPDLYLARFRALGAQTVRILVNWASIAPHWQSQLAPRFNDADPNAYPQANWHPYDTVVRRAVDYGLNIEFTLTGGAPRWAEGPGLPRQGNNENFAWKPDPTRFRHFVHAVAERYDGAFTPQGGSSPLPAVRFWTIWNEPNFGEDLGPEAVAGSTVPNGPRLYRKSRGGSLDLAARDRTSARPDRHRRLRRPRPGSSAVTQVPAGPARRLRSDEAAEIHPRPVLPR